MIDTRWAVETPEGVELELIPAGPVPRALAWAADAGIRTAVYLALAPQLLRLGRVGIGLMLVVLFLLEWFYPVLFEVLGRGRTPGKRLLGLTVLRADGAPVGWSRSTVRSLLMFADFLPFGFAAGLAAMLLGSRGQRLGDLAAGTLVVHLEGGILPRPAAPAGGAAAAERPPQPPPVPLTAPEQRAIMAFAERAPALTPERAQELADLLEPLTGAAGAEGAARLQAMARHLRGLP
jgi:uncharacterized RDD family membrane protein YckC